MKKWETINTITAGHAIVHWMFKKKSMTCMLVSSAPKRLLGPEGPKHKHPLITIEAAADCRERPAAKRIGYIDTISNSAKPAADGIKIFSVMLISVPKAMTT